MSQPSQTKNKDSEDLFTTQDLIHESVRDENSGDLRFQDHQMDDDRIETSEQTEDTAVEDEPTEDLEQIEIENATEEEFNTDDVGDNQAAIVKSKTAAAPVNRITQLPMHKVKHIIKLDPEVKLVSNEAVLLVTKAAEFFVLSLAKESFSFAQKDKKKTITKSHVDQALTMLPVEM